MEMEWAEKAARAAGELGPLQTPETAHSSGSNGKERCCTARICKGAVLHSLHTLQTPNSNLSASSCKDAELHSPHLLAHAVVFCTLI